MPYVYNAYSWVGFDDPKSLRIKVSMPTVFKKKKKEKKFAIAGKHWLNLCVSICPVIVLDCFTWKRIRGCICALLAHVNVVL